MDADVLTLVRDVEVMEPASAGRLQVFGLRHKRGETRAYTVLDDAMAAGTVDVTEIDEKGRVSELKIINRSDTCVFLMAGEGLEGAKQNRVVNASMMVGPHSETIVPVTCIEQGRWGYRSRKFRGSGSSSHGRLRRKMSLDSLSAYERRGRPDSDQHGAWEEVVFLLESVGSSSPSDSLFQAYLDHKTNLEETFSGLRMPQDCTGVVFAIDGKIAGLDIFDRPHTLSKLFPKLVRSFAIDAIHSQSGTASTDERHVADWIKRASEAVSRRFKSPGLGEDVRIEGPACVGACLVVDNHPIHSELFPLEEAL